MEENRTTQDQGSPAWWLLALSMPAVIALGLLFLTRPSVSDNAAQTGVGGGFDKPLITSPTPTSNLSPTPTSSPTPSSTPSSSPSPTLAS